MINFAILQDDQLINLKDKGIACLTIQQGPPIMDFNNIELETLDGQRETDNNVFKPFEISCRFLITFHNKYDYTLLKNDFYNLIYQRKSYHIMSELNPGKRYPVQPGEFEEEEKQSDGAVFKVTFHCFKAHAESIETTQGFQDITTQNWQYSQGLVLEDYEYHFNRSNFSIWNLGDFTIDPRIHDLKITLKGYADHNLTIYNETTGDRFILNDKLLSVRGEELLIDGVYPYKNGIHCGIDTNGELISLAPGENKIHIQNVADVDVNFDFRFLYKS
ncbi:phage tail domain-containing protein [Vagococcus vulneris]|uniref:Siphovirus-type tail component RIFT-related domain-containing protein n=1 Tax=Vagococcus vulneris TaxID=1977869 RepID=A0A429ZTI8_9ENTE|nr:phage tail domain-containing protein [Vagococcus vulneris]RST96940.1 hypothetical protein CBF37_10305 [Vagococcus vulneris]